MSRATTDRLGALLACFPDPVQNSQASVFEGEGKKQGTLELFNNYTLSPCFFLPRAAAIEPDALAIYHRTANNKIVKRTYHEFADRARGFAYYVKKKGYRRVRILCTNTPAFLEAIFGIGAAGAVIGRELHDPAILAENVYNTTSLRSRALEVPRLPVGLRGSIFPMPST